jgi:hypothetical protein
MSSSDMLRLVPLVRTDVSEKPGAYIIRVTRIGELGTRVAVTFTPNLVFHTNASFLKYFFAACVGC